MNLMNENVVELVDVNSMDVLNIMVHEEEFAREFDIRPNVYDQHLFQFLLNKLGGLNKVSTAINLYPWQEEYVDLLINNNYCTSRVVPHIAKRIQFFKEADLIRTLKLIQKGMQLYYMRKYPDNDIFNRCEIIDLTKKNEATRNLYIKSNDKSQKYNKDIKVFREAVKDACKLAPKFNKDFIINKDKDDWCEENLETMYDKSDFLETEKSISKLIVKYRFNNIKLPPLCDSKYLKKNEYKLYKYYKNILTYKKEQKILTDEEIEKLIYDSNNFTRKRVKMLNEAYGWDFYSIQE